MIRRITAAGIVLAGWLTAAWVPAQATGAATAASPAAGSTADCDSVTTCYTPEQLQVAYGVKPLLDRGIDGRGETVVLPELAESTLDPPLVSDMRQDMARFDSLFHLPAARMRVVSSFRGPVSPCWPSAKRCWTLRWSTRSLRRPTSSSSWSSRRR